MNKYAKEKILQTERPRLSEFTLFTRGEVQSYVICQYEAVSRFVCKCDGLRHGAEALHCTRACPLSHTVLNNFSTLMAQAAS